jgi:ABC-type nitrate/sulfonate/bicarbonate transport system ATPase subunit
MAPFIQAQNLTLTFRPKNREPVTALTDLNLAVAKGEFVSIVAPPLQETFLNILCLIKHDSGILGSTANRSQVKPGTSHGFPGVRFAALANRCGKC